MVVHLLSVFVISVVKGLVWLHREDVTLGVLVTIWEWPVLVLVRVAQVWPWLGLVIVV
jgi:hypothetical protein